MKYNPRHLGKPGEGSITPDDCFPSLTFFLIRFQPPGVRFSPQVNIRSGSRGKAYSDHLPATLIPIQRNPTHSIILCDYFSNAIFKKRHFKKK